MTPNRSKDEVLRSLERHRSGLGEGVADASQAAQGIVTTVRRVPAEWRELLPEKARELLAKDWREALDWHRFVAAHDEEIKRGAAATGFVTAGGVVLPRRRRNKRTIVVRGRAMRVDRTSKQLGRAVAGMAAADTTLRHGRLRKAGRRVFKTGRRLALLGTVGGGVAYAATDEAQRQQARDVAGQRVSEIADLVFDRVDDIRANGGPRGLLSR